MKTLIISTILLLTGFAFSQDYDAHVPVTFETGETYYLLADSVNVRKSPGTKADLIAVLPIGTEVKVLSQSKNVTRLNNFNMYWYEVSFDGNRRGYIWGGKIAKTSFRSTNNTDIVFHFGLETVKEENEWEQAYYQIRVEQKGKQINKITLKGADYLFKTHSLTNHGNKGLSNVDDVIYMETYAEACGEGNSTVVIMHTGGKLYEAIRIASAGEVDFEYESLYFPCDMKGRKDHIVYWFESGEYVQPEEKYGSVGLKYDEQKCVLYQWNGERLVQTDQQNKRTKRN